MTVEAIVPASRTVARVGGTCALLFGVAYVAIMVLYVPMGARPRGAEGWLSAAAANQAPWWSILALSVATDFLLVPIALALYVALQDFGRATMLAATAFMGLFAVLDLALTWTNIGALLALGSQYALAPGEVRRMALVAAATYPALVVDSNLLFVYNSLTLAVGILLTGLVMRRGRFAGVTAHLGIVTGVLATVAVASSFVSDAVSGIAIILASALTTLWFFLVGYGLFRQGQIRY